MNRSHKMQIIVGVVNKAIRPLQQIHGQLGRIGAATGLTRLGTSAAALGPGLMNVAGAAAVTGKRLTALGAITGVGALAFVRKMANSADLLAKTSKRLGVSVESLQRLEHHAELSGVATGEFRNSLRFLLNAAGEAAQGLGMAKDTFVGLGIDVKDANGNLKDAETLMFEVAAALEKVEDDTARVAIAQDLFGRSGAVLIPMLKDGAEAMRASGKEAERLGLITKEQAAVAENFNDMWTRVSRALGHMGMTMALEVMPVMTRFLDWAKEISVRLKPGIVEAYRQTVVDLSVTMSVLTRWQKAVSEGWTRWVSGAPIIGKLIGWLGALHERIGTTRLVVSAVALAITSKLILAILGLFAPLTGLAVSLTVVAAKMTILGSKGVAVMVKGLIALAPAIWGAVTATAAWTVALLANPLTWIVAAVIALGAAAILLVKNWDKVAAFFIGLWESVRAAFADGLTQITEWLTGFDFFSVGSRWIEGLGTGMRDKWTAIVAWLQGAVATMTEWMPDWVKEKMGISAMAVESNPQAQASVPLPATQKSEVGGEIKVSFDNAPAGTKVQAIRQTPGSSVGVLADMGYAMGGAI